MKKKIILISVLIILIISCFLIILPNLTSKDIKNLIFVYQDENKMEFFLENENNLSKDVYWKKYDLTFNNIEVNKQYWKIIINTINKSNFSFINLDFIVKKYKISQPIFTFKIIYQNGKEIRIDLWDGLLNISGIWYEETNLSKNKFFVINEIIHNYYIEHTN